MVGLGEATVEGREKTVEAAIKENARYLVGKDPHNIEEHWQAMYKGAFWRGGPILNSAISGIEIALWDILGK
jgi:galactonate dehydratase